MQAVLWMWPAMYRSIYGRFLLLQLDSASIVAVLSVLLSILSVASRLCSRKACSGLRSTANLYGTVITSIAPSRLLNGKQEPYQHANSASVHLK